MQIRICGNISRSKHIVKVSKYGKVDKTGCRVSIHGDIQDRPGQAPEKHDAVSPLLDRGLG